MLEKIDLNKKIDNNEAKEIFKENGEKLSVLQRELRKANIPVIILFEGLSAAGKGTQINRLIENLDPRGFKVYATNKENEDEKMHSFLWRFWTKTPAKGSIAIFDRSWYRRVLSDRFSKNTSTKELEGSFSDIKSFEKLLTDDNVLIIKLFLYISKKEQKKRFEILSSSKETAWRVNKEDIEKNKKYDDYLKINEEMLERTDTEYAPWTIVEACDRQYAATKILSTVVEKMEYALNRSQKQIITKPEKVLSDKRFDTKILSGVDLSKSIQKNEYKHKLENLQKELGILHSELYRLRIPVVIAFEGWDAGGKGGAIKRSTSNFDPRGYVVNPTSSPNDIERQHHYLWRFWNNMPKNGHIAIFDRTWYGRVMVERIEGFCSENEWNRAYSEINQMEEHLYNNGTVILKFWLHIDKDEQERRFKERMEDPTKQWKITDEDWRNREKWNEYEEAVDEMLVRTSTTYAPWTIVEGNDKMYARIKVLESVVNALKNKVKELNK